MESNYCVCQTPQFRVLADVQIRKLFLATLECLQRTGVDVYNEEARDLLAQAGAHVNGKRVHIPPHIIQDAIAANPRTFSLWGRDQKHQLQIVPDRVYFGPGPTCTYYVDPETGERRPTRQGDPTTTARVCDALQNIDYVMSLGLISDVHHRLASVYEYAEMVAHTTKPILAWAFDPEQVSDIYEIALAVAGDQDTLRRYPPFAMFSTFQSPLVHTHEDLANAFWAAEHDVPVIYLGGGTAGSSSPVTGASLFVIYLAGALSGLAMIHLKRRGARVCIGGVLQPMDLRTGRPAYGGPEMSLYGAAMADVSRYLGLPFMGTAGISESKVLDLQAAIESSIQMTLSGLSGATLVHDIGMLDCADIGSLEMLVMNDEIAAMVRRILRGVEISDETLMLDLIDQVGPGGEFMTAKDTAKRCRSEIWTPTLMDRDAWVNWQANGALTMQDRIKHKLDVILKTHQPQPISQAAQDRIDQILQAANERETTRER